MNMYTPYRDKMCQKCGKKPYTFFITNPSNDILIDPVNEYVCVDCAPEMFFTTVKPESIIKSLELVDDNTSVLTLRHDLNKANEKIRRLQAENKSVTDYCISILDCDRCQCGKCVFCEAKVFIAQIKENSSEP